VVGELVDNIYQHSEFTMALVMAQKYPKKGFVELGFFDNGITIPGSFLKQGLIYDEEEAHKAIADALKGLSSKGGKERGHGLRSSVRIFLEGLGGEVLIISGAGAVYMSKQGSSCYVLGGYHKLGGTLISIRIQDLAKQINIYNYVE
ncbi:MAG: ATP-binding protein, partial [Nitrososphaerales archaeon]